LKKKTKQQQKKKATTTTTAVTRRTRVHSLTKEVPRKSHKSSAIGGVFDTYWSFNRPTKHHLRLADELLSLSAIMQLIFY